MLPGPPWLTPPTDRLPAPDGAESGPNNGSGSLQATRPTSFRFVRARRRKNRGNNKMKPPTGDDVIYSYTDIYIYIYIYVYIELDIVFEFEYARYVYNYKCLFNAL